MHPLPRPRTRTPRAAAGERSRNRAWLGWAFVLAGAVALLVGRAPAQGQELTEAERARGETIYQQQCLQCHGGAGEGAVVPQSGREAPPVNDVGVAYVDLVLRTGRMPPPGDPFDNRARRVQVEGEDRRALVGWMAEAFELEGDIPVPPEGNAAEGLQVYNDNCAHCHGNTGAGGVAGAGAWTPALLGYDPVTIAEATRVGPFEMPRFSEDQITEQQVGDVVAYLAEVREHRGTPVFGLVELNPVYASAFVALLAVAMMFSIMWIGGRPSWFPDRTPPPTDDPEGPQT